MKMNIVNEQNGLVIEGNVVVGVLDSVIESMEEVRIPSFVKSIAEYAFAGCLKLSKVVLPEGVVVHSYAFSECEALREIKLPKGVVLHPNAFAFCDGLQKVEFLGDVRSNYFMGFEFGTPFDAYDDALRADVFEASPVKTLVFHGNVEYTSAFRNIKGIREIIIKDREVARQFWKSAISDNPWNFYLLQTDLFNDKAFRDECLENVNDRMREMLKDYYMQSYEEGQSVLTAKVSQIVADKIEIEERKILRNGEEWKGMEEERHQDNFSKAKKTPPTVTGD